MSFAPRVLALALMGSLAQHTHAADDCAGLPPPSVTVKRLEAPVQLNTTYTYRQLNALGSATARPGTQVLGLTRGEATVRFEISLPTRVDRKNRWECASPQVVLNYGFSPMTVYVAREFPPGTCAHEEIYTHELAHVAAYRGHVEAIEATLTAALQQRFLTNGPWRGSVGQTRARLEEALQKEWIPFVKREMRRVDAANAAIDAPEEYQRISASCDGEIQRILRQQRRNNATSSAPEPPA